MPAMKLAALAPILFTLAACTTHPSPPPESASATAPSVPNAAASDKTAGPLAVGASSAPSSAPLAPSSAPLATDDLVGREAPDFTATAQDGTSVHLSALRGKRVVVYFYPKDETPGCTKEACSFRDSWQSISGTGAVLVGVSADKLESHRSFAEHYKLPFLLVSDADGSIGRSYGVPFAGRHRRQTVVIGPDGKVRKVYRTVDVTIHAQQILDDLVHLS